MLFPRSVSDLLEAMVSVKRIEDFLLSETLDDVLTEREADMGADGWPKVCMYARLYVCMHL